MAGIVVYYPEEWSTAHTVLHVNLSRRLTEERGVTHSESLDFFSEEFTSSFYVIFSFPSFFSTPLPFFYQTLSIFSSMILPSAALRMTS